MTQAIDALFAPWSRTDSPGAVVAVTRNGQETHYGAHGMASLAHAVPLDRRSVIRIGSQTKQFTVLLSLILERAGKLSMADDVQKYAPWFAPTPHRVTLEHLARNTSGLRDFLEMMTWSGLRLAAPSTRQTARDLMARHAEMNFVPGTAMLYCNTGFFLLSEIIEDTTGRSYNELLAEHLTGPLGMADSVLMGADSAILPRLADMHLQTPEGLKTARWGLILGGEGGMVSTLDDMLRWQAMLAAPPAHLAPLLARMEQATPYDNGTTALYAMGLTSVPYRGLTTIGHGGGVAGGKSESMRLVEKDLGIVIIANLDDFAPYPLARRIADIALADELGPRPALPDLSAATGLWREEGGDDLLGFATTPAGPVLISSVGAASLDMIAPDTIAPERPTWHLTFAPPTGDTFQARFCGRPTTYRRLPPTPGGSLANLAGTYTNPGLGITALIDGSNLTIRSHLGSISYALAWADRDLLLILPPEGPTATRPFAATLKLTDGAITITTDRTRGLVLRRFG